MEFIRIHGGRLWEWFRARAHGPHALFWLIVLSVLEPVFSPIIPETLMVPMVLAHREGWKTYAAIVVGFTAAGSIIGYLIGGLFFNTLGSYLLSLQHAGAIFERAQALMSAHAFLTMFWVAFTPLPDKAFVLAAGFLSSPFAPFLLGFIIGRAGRVFLLAYVLHRYGTQAMALMRRYFAALAVVALLIIAALFVSLFR